MPHTITGACIGVKDTACVDVCPVDCIHGKGEELEMLFIHPEVCIDCGICVDACPVQAIYPEEFVPAQWRSFIARNYSHFGLTRP